MIVKMIQGLRKTMEKMQEMFTTDLQELKNKQMNNTLEGISSRRNQQRQKNGSMTGRTEWWKSLPQNRILKEEKEKK